MKKLNLKAERIKRGFSAEYMASLLDVSCSAYYKYECGKNNIPLNKAQ
ncbi:helix-turn-helix domain-containing protein [Peptostreptococcus sp.]